MLTYLHGDALLGALGSTLTASGAGFSNLMGSLALTGDSFKLASTLAQGAANTFGFVDLSDLAIIKISPNSRCGANFSAHHATNALVHIKHRQMIDDSDRTELTLIGADLTTDAAHAAVISYQLALFGSAAHQANGGVHGLESQHMLGAGINALAAALTFFRINHSQLLMLIDVDGIEGAGTNAGAQAKAGMRASLVAVRNKRSSNAILDTVVIELGLALFSRTLANNGSDHLCTGVYRFNTHDTGNLLSNGGTAHRAGVDRGFAGSNRIGKTIAAGITASAAVSAGQNFTNSVTGGVGRHCKYLGGKSQQQAENETHCANHKGSSQNSTH